MMEGQERHQVLLRQKLRWQALSDYVKGRLQSASSAANKAKDISDLIISQSQNSTTGGKDYFGLLPDYAVISKINFGISDLEGAKEYLHKALKLANAMNEKSDVGTDDFQSPKSFVPIFSFSILGELFLQFNQVIIAEKMLLKHRSVVELLFGENHPLSSDCYQLLSAFYLAAGLKSMASDGESNLQKTMRHFSQSIYFSTECLRIREALLGPMHDLVAYAYLNKFYVLQGYEKFLLTQNKNSDNLQSQTFENLASDIIDCLLKVREIHAFRYTPRSLEVLRLDLLLYGRYKRAKMLKNMFEIAEKSYHNAVSLVGQKHTLTTHLFGKLNTLNKLLLQEDFVIDKRLLKTTPILDDIIPNSKSQEPKLDSSNKDKVLVSALPDLPERIEVQKLLLALDGTRVRDNIPAGVVPLARKFVSRELEIKNDMIYIDKLTHTIGLLYPKYVLVFLDNLSKALNIIDVEKSDIQHSIEKGHEKKSGVGKAANSLQRSVFKRLKANKAAAEANKININMLKDENKGALKRPESSAKALEFLKKITTLSTSDTSPKSMQKDHEDKKASSSPSASSYNSDGSPYDLPEPPSTADDADQFSSEGETEAGMDRSVSLNPVVPELSFASPISKKPNSEDENITPIPHRTAPTPQVAPIVIDSSSPIKRVIGMKKQSSFNEDFREHNKTTKVDWDELEEDLEQFALHSSLSTDILLQAKDAIDAYLESLDEADARGKIPKSIIENLELLLRCKSLEERLESLSGPIEKICSSFELVERSTEMQKVATIFQYRLTVLKRPVPDSIIEIFKSWNDVKDEQSIDDNLKTKIELARNEITAIERVWAAGPNVQRLAEMEEELRECKEEITFLLEDHLGYDEKLAAARRKVFQHLLDTVFNTEAKIIVVDKRTEEVKLLLADEQANDATDIIQGIVEVKSFL